jgi:SMC interacting uncharacterized protein involved in chromosome segregation
MSFISDIVKKGSDLKSLIEGMSTLATSVAKLAMNVEKLSKMVQEQDMLLAELYAMQIHILKSADNDVPEMKFVEKTDRKTEKPN